MANYLKLNKSYIGNDILENPEFNMLGPDIITNGNFETDSNWSIGSGWQIYGGKAVCDGTSGNLQQASILTIGKIYTVTITISDYVSGNVQVSVGEGPRDIFTANGTYTVTQTAQPNSSFYIVSSSFEGAVESVIVQESGQIEFVDNGGFYGVADDTDVTTLSGWSVASASYPATSTDVVDQKLVIVSGGIYEGAGYDLTGIADGMEVNLKIESVTGDIGNGALYLNGTGIDIPTDSGSVDYTFIKEASNTKLLFRAGFNTAGTTNYENISIQPTNVFAYAWNRGGSGVGASGEFAVFNGGTVTLTTLAGASNAIIATDTPAYLSGSELILKFNVLSKSDGVIFQIFDRLNYLTVDAELGENEFRYKAAANGTNLLVNVKSTGATDEFITLDNIQLQEVKNQPKLIGVDNVSTVSAPTNSTVVINNGLTDGADTITITYAEADASSTVQMRNFFQDAIVESANANNTGKVIEIKSPVLINDIVAS
jgi:hypothetical protein